MSAAFGWPLASPLLTLGGALLLDRFVGEPPNAFHPVAWMGHAIHGVTWLLLRGGPRRSFASGLLVAGVLPLSFALGSHAILSLSRALPWLQVALGALLLKSTFALRALGEAGRGVQGPLDRGDLAGARLGLRSLCSRDPSALDGPSLVAATVESLAENTSDSVVAPLFFFVIFGVPGAVFYRAVNTLDAMVGYHGRFEWFGKASARLDDLMNVVPARLTALLLLASGAARGFDGPRGARVLFRDGGATESPNAGRPMAAMAGLLGVSLVKEGHYALGDPRNRLEPKVIDHAWRIAAPAGLLAALFAACATAYLSTVGAHHGF